MSKHIPVGVRAVFFDAVGTLIHPEPSVGEVYYRTGKRYGSQLEAKEIGRRFRTAFATEEQHDASNGNRCDEARELQRWTRIVTAILDDVRDREACFRELYDHFARPEAWRVEEGAAQVLRQLRTEGYVVGVASNFDHRLRTVVEGLPSLGRMNHLAISSELGWKKPASEFFAALCAMTGCLPGEILVVGDDEENDIAGAQSAGMHALRVDSADPLVPSLRVVFGC